MRVSQEEKTKTRGRILASAARRLREDGVAGVGLSEVMRDAGLTNGGFYRHFPTRDAMVTAALQAAFDQFLVPLEAAMSTGDPEAALAAFRALYLSQGHVQNPGEGCPVPAVGSEMAHQGADLRKGFSEGVNRVIGLFAAARPGEPAERRRLAIRDLSMLVGAVILARAVDPAIAGQILSAGTDPA